MFGSENRVAMKHKGFADRLFLCDLLFSQPESFGTITRSTIRCNRFVEGKDTSRFGGGLLGVFETTLVIAGFNIVMGELLNGAANCFAISLETFGDMTMQTPAADGIKFFVQNLANFVVCEDERIV